MLVVFATSACGSGIELPRDLEPLLQTEVLEYRLTAESISLTAQIPYTFENRTGASVFLVNCNGDFALLLQRLEGNEWVTRWGPLINSCLSPPIVIDDGELYSDTVYVWGAQHGSNAMPQFRVADPGGTYRILWVDALSSFQNTLPFGPQIAEAYRVSNSFLLIED